MTLPPSRLALVGLMGSGKSRVGTHLAARLGWPFLDQDRLLEDRSGRTVSQIFRREGERGFRDREAALLRELSLREPPFVLATGGGVVERPENRTLLARDFLVVWISIAPAEAARRLPGVRGRPLLEKGDPRDVLAALAARRDPLYEALARHRVETGSETRPETLAEEVLRLLGAS